MTRTEAASTFILQCEEIAAGRRGFLSITKFAKASGLTKEALANTARAFGLHVFPAHGRFGMTARRAL